MQIKKLFSILLLLSTPAFCQDWTSLFNGKDLSGWKTAGGNAPFKVEDNAIVGYAVKGTPNTFLRTNEEFGDFVLEMEVYLEDPLNSGIQFRSQQNKEGNVYGYQMEIDPVTRDLAGGIYDEGRRGWLYYPEVNPKAVNIFQLNQWNVYKIEAVGNVLRTFINGNPVSHLIDDVTPKGFIALQVHSISDKSPSGMKIKWRNIRINTKSPKLSKPDQAPVVNLLDNNLSEQELHQGYKLLFNGKDFTGWREAKSPNQPKTRWSIDNGILKVKASDGSETGNDIVTVDQYSAFEMVFDFKFAVGANSGVKYFVNESHDSKGLSAIGLEYQILDDEKHPDAKAGVVGNRTLASLYDLIPSEKYSGWFKGQPEKWNSGRLIVFPNNTVQHWLNGRKVLEYKRKDNIYKALVARSKYNVFEGFGSGDKGHILLQDHGDHVEFKNVKIRSLK
jgi:hypothetical protein